MRGTVYRLQDNARYTAQGVTYFIRLTFHFEARMTAFRAPHSNVIWQVNVFLATDTTV